jgi:hypothetical protein
MGIDVIPTEAVSVPDGQHTGRIFAVKKEVRGEGKYTYIDVYVTVDGLTKSDGSPVVIKDGMSKHLSINSKLGKTCMRFGLSEEDLDKATKEGIPLDVTNFLRLDTPVQYMVLTETKDGKTYARIVDGSLKSREEPQRNGSDEVFGVPAKPEAEKEESPEGGLQDDAG